MAAPIALIVFFSTGGEWAAVLNDPNKVDVPLAEGASVLDTDLLVFPNGRL